jgi:hypothetical protein
VILATSARSYAEFLTELGCSSTPAAASGLGRASVPPAVTRDEKLDLLTEDLEFPIKVTGERPGERSATRLKSYPAGVSLSL